MNSSDLQLYLYEHIPLSKAMQVSVLDASPTQVTLSAPLAPNINHRETVFGGSASALAILSAWSLLHVRTTLAGISARLVIHQNSMRYDLPMLDTFVAICAFDDQVVWDRFLKLLQRKGRARIHLDAVINCHEQQTGSFSGEFVALR
jgi:thioesterase domain-containing protein